MDDKKLMMKGRAAVARRAGSLLRTDTSFREALTVVAPDGSHPIVAATLEDRVEDVFNRLGHLHPEGANVVVGAATGNLVTLTVRRELAPQLFGCHPDDCPIHPDSQMAMLVAYVLTQPGKTIRCQIIKLDYQVELDDLPCVPA